MKITKIETLICDAGWRPWLFVKISTDEDITGYSECTDSHGSPQGLFGVVRDLERLLIGQDPRATERLYWDMYRNTRQSPGSIIQKAMGGIENALLDIKAKALGIPVYELFGGPLRDKARVYWSHCGTTRARAAQFVGERPVRTLDDIVELGYEVKEKGFTALKTNFVTPGEDAPTYMPGFGGPLGTTDQNVDRELLRKIEALMNAFRKGAGDQMDLMLDLNFTFKTEGNRLAAKALEKFDLLWFELDVFDPKALLQVKMSTTLPICSGENLYGLRGFRPFFEGHAMDVAMVDIIWNGLAQSLKIAHAAETYEMNVAPHNYYSHLATLISAHFGACVPNLRILETDVDDVPWKDELVTQKVVIENGYMKIPTTPGWGADLNEEVIKAHPWTR